MKLEKMLEAKCRALALSCDGELLPFRPGKRGWHDRLLLLPGYMALIEFKRMKKAVVQPLQNDRQAWCEARRIPAFRVWDYGQFEEIMRKASPIKYVVRETPRRWVNYRTIPPTFMDGCICAFGKPNPQCQAKSHGGLL
jgi:hypothetical protein